MSNNQAAAFGIEEMTCFYMEDTGFKEGTEAVYGNRIDIIETPNDTTHEVNVGKNVPVLFSEEKLKEIVESGYVEAHYLDVVLYDLFRKNVIKAGTYFIRVAW